VAVIKEGARRLEGVVAGDLEAVEEAAGLHAQREGDADVAALVRTARTRDRQLILLLSSGSLQLEQERPCCKED
jgi:hypothetical protein